jgi:putative flippase GtrA
VGAAGFVLQIAAVAVLTLAAGWASAPATATAVELAILHNFFWHERWTWKVQNNAGRLHRLVRFHLATGTTSLAGNLLFTAVAGGVAGLNPVVANVIAVALMALTNYRVADRWIFGRGALPEVRQRNHRGRMLALAVWATAVLGWPSGLSGSELKPATVAAWDRHVAATEARIRDLPPAPSPIGKPEGRSIDIPGGTIHEWRGSALIRGLSVADLVDALADSGVPPPAEEVVESRVLARFGDAVHVYLKLVRRAIITVTYDTEHDVTFVRGNGSFATSHSVSTKIVETTGKDRGFLWRLNSYWRYQQVGEAVKVDVLSVSLSREVPWVVRPVVGPLVGRIAHESVVRALESVQRFGEQLREAGVRSVRDRSRGR